MASILVADTPAAIAAAEAFAVRTGTCVQSEAIPYCPCPPCVEDAAAEAAAEIYAEGAWLRYAEGGWDLTGHGYQEGCPCC